jgi:AcrR family transcriptional regulator
MDDLHQRILSAAYPLFVRRGIRDVTLDEVQQVAGVTTSELSEEFPSRDALAVECLQLREQEWTVGVVEAGARSRAGTPEGRLLAIFDVFDEWFHRDDYEACTFINVLLEMGREHPLGRASVEHLSNIRRLVRDLALEAGLTDPERFALSWHILMKGSIINAVEGDQDAAMRARVMAADLIARHRPTAYPKTLSHADVDWFDHVHDPDVGREDAGHAAAGPRSVSQVRATLLELIARHRDADPAELTDEEVDWFRRHTPSAEAPGAGETGARPVRNGHPVDARGMDPRWAFD